MRESPARHADAAERAFVRVRQPQEQSTAPMRIRGVAPGQNGRVPDDTVPLPVVTEYVYWTAASGVAVAVAEAPGEAAAVASRRRNDVSSGNCSGPTAVTTASKSAAV